MIVRVFTATVPTELQSEFESKFKEISVPLVKKFDALISVEIGRPTETNPNEFVMISRWRDLQGLITFVGEKWNEAHIPAGMGKYIIECKVMHFDPIEL